MDNPLISMRNVTKRFPGVLANDRVDLDVQRGEIHALLGENGAGKTTLMNILYGMWDRDEGDIVIRGHKINNHSPANSFEFKLGMVHQHFALVPRLTVAENVVPGSSLFIGFFFNLREVASKIEEFSKSFGLRIDPYEKVENLSPGEQQRVEIVKVLSRGIEIIILDEPTSLLIPQEIEQLFTILRAMKERGHTIIFITHKLNEVMEISDRVAVMRDGRVVSTVATADVAPRELARMMVDRDVVYDLPKTEKGEGQPLLRVKDLHVNNEEGLPALKGITFDVHGGEILGVAGISGNGQKELSDSITGLRKIESGSVFLGDEEITYSSPQAILEKGVRHIPEDRLNEGTIAGLSIGENLILSKHTEAPYKKGWFMDYAVVRRDAERLMSEHNIKASSHKTLAKTLSGGNLQKLILARELSSNPRVLVVNNPTNGLDIGATEYTRLKLLEQKEKGAAVLLISTDLDEIQSLSDRIMVLFDGEVMGFVNTGIGLADLGLMMAGAIKHKNTGTSEI
jgi:simple sugar transport system ATP-binding protein